MVAADKASFRPYYAMSYMYEELLALDAGSWFNETSIEQARKSFAENINMFPPLKTRFVTPKAKC